MKSARDEERTLSPSKRLGRPRLSALMAACAATILCLVAAACGGEPMSTLSQTPGSSTPHVQVASTSIPFSAAGTQAVVAAVGDYVVTMIVPPNDQSNTANTFDLTISNAPLTGMPSVPPQVVDGKIRFGLLYGFATSSSGGTLYGFPALQIRVPKCSDSWQTAGPCLYLIDAFDPSNPGAGFSGWQSITGWVWASSSIIHFSKAVPPFTMLANKKYWFLLEEDALF